MSRRRRQLFFTAIGGAPQSIASLSFGSEGGPIPWYAGATQENAYSLNGKTYVAFETYEPTASRRFTRVKALTEATGVWDRSYPTGQFSQASSGNNDSHGVPALAANADGRGVVAWGNHDGNFRLAVMTNPHDESVWSGASDLTGAYTYPHLVLSGTTMYCFLRLNTAPGTEFTNGAKYLVYRPITFAAEVATVGAQVKIADFGDNSRWYQGNCILLGNGRIAQVACRADFGDTFRRDVYYYEIDIAGAQLVAFDGTTAAFPVSAATMNSTFRLHTTSVGSNLQVPHMTLDAAGRTHIVFSEGVADSDDVPIYHMIGDGSVFGSPTLVSGAVVSRDQDAPRLINEASNALGLYWPNDPKDPETFAGGGNVYRKLLPAVSLGEAGAFGPTLEVMKFDTSRWPINQIGKVFNASPTCRVTFCEVAMSENDADALPYKRLFARGDNGIVGKAQPTVPALDPTNLFAEFDPSNLATMWQDTAGTVPAAVGQPVGRWIDATGISGIVLQSQGSEFPILRENDGCYWLDFGDRISPTSIMLSTAEVTPIADGEYWIACSSRHWADVSQSQDVVCIDDGATDRYMRLVAASISSLGSTLTFVTNQAGPNLTRVGLARYTCDVTMGGHIDGTAASFYVNGSLADTDTTTNPPDSTPAPMRIGANSAGGNLLRGRVYGVIMRRGNGITEAIRLSDHARLMARLPK